MKLVALVGSIRNDSYNLKLAKTIQDRYSEVFELEIPNLGELPHFNQEQELDPPSVVAALKLQASTADGFIFATPEYNWSVPGVLKNALDWLSRGGPVMKNKPVIVVGASTGMLGTIRAQIHLRQILSSPGLSCRIFPPGGNEVLISFADKKFDESGRLADESTLSFLDDVITRFVHWI